MDIDSNPFSAREKDVVKLLLQGKSNKQIALELGISNRTVEFHLGNIYAKLGVASRTEAVLKLSENHLRKSTGDEDRIQVKSTVEVNHESLENEINLISRRIPMKTLLYLMGGGLLTMLLVVALVLANPPTKKFDLAPTQTTASPASEEAEIRELVENFGKRLQTVSLSSIDAAHEMQKQYVDFISSALLETWMKDVTKAPGRIVSSPWPDRIEITALSKEGADWYVMTGFVIEVTSVEMVNGGAAVKRPVHIVVRREQGRWLITEYTEERE